MTKNSQTTSARMKKVKSKGTKLEITFLKILKTRGLRYESQPRILGHPDFRIRGTRVLIFCDSSFWHGRNKNELSGRAFKRNRDFWIQKLACNKARDNRISRSLRSLGWTVLRFWDTDIYKRPTIVKNRLSRFVNTT